MSNSVSNQNPNNTTNINSNIPKDNANRLKYCNQATTRILKALFESEHYCFSSFSSRDHGKLVKETIKNSKKQDRIPPKQLDGDSVVNEFINHLYRGFSDFLCTKDLNQTHINNGVVKYEVYSIQSLHSAINADITKSIWLPTSMTIAEAHRILSTILYSSGPDRIPVDLEDYVLVYENIMISLENQSKELYEEILKISFRLNRVALPPFRLLIIHKSQLLLLERKESEPLLAENESISILQLIMFHLITNYNNQSENGNFDYADTSSMHHRNKYWAIIEVKMGIIPSKLINPLQHDKLRQIVTHLIQTNDLSEDMAMNVNTCIRLLKIIFLSANANISYIDFITPSLLKLVQIYDYPLLIALPYDRLMLSEFKQIQCSDGRYAQGIMTNGKYYSLINHPYTPMSTLKINRGSIIHLRFNPQHDTIFNGNASSQSNQITINESYDEILRHHCSVYCDNKTVQLMFPLQVIDSMISFTGTTRYETKIDYLRACFKVSNNWLDPSMRINNLIASEISVSNMNQLNIQNIYPRETYENNYSDPISTDDYHLVRLINHASTSSLPSENKPECLNCLSPLDDDILECPYCTQVFCRHCIEYSYAYNTRDFCCPRCNNLLQISDYQEAIIIRKLEREGISALKCLKCRLIPRSHRLCCDPKCSALFCYNCCRQAGELQSSSIVQDHNFTETMKCLKCKTADTYVSYAILYYTDRIIKYETARNIELRSTVSESESELPLPNTVWKEEDWLPEEGTLEENYNRVISVIHFEGVHIQFGVEKEKCPLLIINEPLEYICPESLQLSYWNTENEINRWEKDNNIHFFKYNQSSVAAYIPHFSKLTVHNRRFREHFILDIASLDFVRDYDFTKINDAGKSFMRGPEPYQRPCGWFRKAVRVLHKFENYRWLNPGADGWPVAYHGTSADNIKSILRNGLRAGGSNGIRMANGNVYGPGIYLSPNPLYSGQVKYSRPFYHDGCKYQVMFQARVKSDSIEKQKDINIWKCTNSSDIRLYGILIRELQ